MSALLLVFKSSPGMVGTRDLYLTATRPGLYLSFLSPQCCVFFRLSLTFFRQELPHQQAEEEVSIANQRICIFMISAPRAALGACVHTNRGAHRMTRGPRFLVPEITYGASRT
jgi:hypothetical protein